MKKTKRNKQGEFIIHNKSHTKVWAAWQKMKSRCLNPKNPKYKTYGEAGRFICEGLMMFVNFYSVVGEPPTKNHSLDREDNNGNYTCGVCDMCIKNNYKKNIRWATPKEQSRNVSTNFIVNYNGVNMSLVEAAEMAKIPYKRVFSRIVYSGWDVDKALSVKGSLKEKITINGLSLLDLSKKYNIHKQTLKCRLEKNNWDLDKVLKIPLIKRNRKK